MEIGEERYVSGWGIISDGIKCIKGGKSPINDFKIALVSLGIVLGLVHPSAVSCVIVLYSDAFTWWHKMLTGWGNSCISQGYFCVEAATL